MEMLHICVLLPLNIVAMLFDLAKVWWCSRKNVLPLRNTAVLAAGPVCMLSQTTLVLLPIPVMMLRTRLQLADPMERTKKELPLIISQVCLLAALACLLSVPFCILLTAAQLLVLCNNISSE